MEFHITQDFRCARNGKDACQMLRRLTNDGQDGVDRMCSDTKRGSMLLMTTSPGSMQGCGADRAHIAPLVQVSRAPRWVQLRG